MTAVSRISLARVVLSWQFTSPLLLTAVADNGEDLDLVVKSFLEASRKMNCLEEIALQSDDETLIEVSARILRGEALADSVGCLLAWCASDLPLEEPVPVLSAMIEEIRQARRLSLMQKGL